MSTEVPETGEPQGPPVRNCATDEVHRRLLLEVPEYAEARAAVENAYFYAAGALSAGTLDEVVGREGITTIPVVVHIVGNADGAGAVTDEQVHAQIAVLNADYRAANPDVTGVPEPFRPLVADTRIEFALATTGPDGAATTGIHRVPSDVEQFTADDDAVKAAATGGADAWPADRYLNLWVCRLEGGLLGYAQFPGGPAATDGVVITYTGFGTGGTARAPFDGGRTATHEIGHWLNLRHIWGDDDTGCSGSDFVADTPNCAGPNTGRPTFPHVTCYNGPDGDLFMNYMDYTDDAAMVMFTAGQAFRMQAALGMARPTIGQP
jgi:Pregnancy-associated plasma protein-A